MAEVICLKFGRESGIFCENFNLIDGEECFVKIDVSGANGFRDVRVFKITLEWKQNLNLFIRVKIYNSIRDYCYNRTIILNNCKLTSFHGSLTLASQNFLLISISRIAECKNLRNYDLNLPSCSSKGPTVVLEVNPQKELTVEGNCSKQLSWDIENLLKTGYLSDVILTDGTNEIRAHKLILSARSPVFAKMFQHEMKETLENVITIKDISMKALENLINFMYTGLVKITDVEMAIDLYVAGDKYDMKYLKDVSSKMLLEVDLDSVIKVILLADLYHDKPLKQAAVNFISENYSQVKALESWTDLLKENLELAIEVLSSVVDRTLSVRMIQTNVA